MRLDISMWHRRACQRIRNRDRWPSVGFSDDYTGVFTGVVVDASGNVFFSQPSPPQHQWRFPDADNFATKASTPPPLFVLVLLAGSR